jgi:hypothetical protein
VAEMVAIDLQEEDEYLVYIAYTCLAQVLTNEGRRIGNMDFKKADKDLEGKKGGKR